MPISSKMATTVLALSLLRGGSAFVPFPPARIGYRVLGSRMSMSSGPSMPASEEEMPFYALGVNLARQLGGQVKDLIDEDETEIVLRAFGDTMRGTLADPQTILVKYGPQLNTILQERSNSVVERTKKAADEYVENFLACNEEAVRTESGLVYCSMVEGTGKQPAVTDTVEVHYHGTLLTGEVFDSSVDRGQTISFPLSNVIKGWQEGVAMMKEGGKATLICPSDLAYGETGSGDLIGPGATLKFEVELFKVS
mmetsp:Transcript_17141/g.38616  ORF Transcript_17141/g.38616 Transcript_17141/m.38616 type:complete len:253 (-) Transcript_17141:687-1445(-)|eukprot:CAMPEP_0113296994 /NCGR_PEP_ID=MMETSP0010_2-20120614/44_1 /TAXON_ID=216773 ORGANISM="Corethron hystrix, Strain 308" /NCGR_SAMPLE_ID=MMETSP0010_2 /ASSEMBLY_ACC=CAM_ASM_000155 /LENGTH=252 /DNA_ID=CAMNT_0000149815 /DNA_START=38 /DNA_END=796 /DNA_ORIENTATION=- /assembly_acc=CAM_ASM_000155